MNFSIDECHNYKDHRGNLVEFVSETFLKERALPFGQIYFVTFNGSNVIRGNHYHQNSSEAFCLVHGTVEIVLEDIATKERFSQIYYAGQTHTYRITIGPLIAHAIRCISDFAVLISYSSKVYDSDDQDKYPYKLL